MQEDATLVTATLPVTPIPFRLKWLSACVVCLVALTACRAFLRTALNRACTEDASVAAWTFLYLVCAFLHSHLCMPDRRQTRTSYASLASTISNVDPRWAHVRQRTHPGERGTSSVTSPLVWWTEWPRQQGSTDLQSSVAYQAGVRNDQIAYSFTIHYSVGGSQSMQPASRNASCTVPRRWLSKRELLNARGHRTPTP